MGHLSTIITLLVCYSNEYRISFQIACISINLNIYN